MHHHHRLGDVKVKLQSIQIQGEQLLITALIGDSHIVQQRNTPTLLNIMRVDRLQETLVQ